MNEKRQFRCPMWLASQMKAKDFMLMGLLQPPCNLLFCHFSRVTKLCHDTIYLLFLICFTQILISNTGNRGVR
uniref:Uncharacterized protein n=1 Tax=Picea sitchensis TaxID=3332 RepID=A0A6B9XST9_PICSI|nr:hypothetical protein Q903MT_gene5815 [Picea sitchensis]